VYERLKDMGELRETALRDASHAAPRTEVEQIAFRHFGYHCCIVIVLSRIVLYMSFFLLWLWLWLLLAFVAGLMWFLQDTLTDQ